MAVLLAGRLVTPADALAGNLSICAFVASAAPFRLPISKPSNLVIYGIHMPPLGQ